MIIKNGKTISSIIKGNQVIDKIYKGTLVIYEAFKKLLIEGYPLTLNKSKGVDLVDYKIYGNSVQEGANLLYKDLSQMGYWGAYITDNGYSISGVLWSELTPYTGQTSTSLDWYVTNPIEIKPNTSYKYSGLQSANNPAYIFLEEDKTTIINGKAIKGSGSFITPSNARYIVMSIRTDVIETMRLEEAPSPETPIEVDSVGDKTINLFNINNYPNVNDNGFRYVIGASSSSSSTGLTLKEFAPSLEVDKTYTISYKAEVYQEGNLIEIAGTGIYFNSFVSNNLWASGTSKTLTQENLDAIIRVGTSKLNNLDRTVVIYDIQIEEGNTVTDYEPYGYKVPVKVSGKNLVNVDEWIANNDKLVYSDGIYTLTNVGGNQSLTQVTTGWNAVMDIEKLIKLNAGTYTIKFYDLISTGWNVRYYDDNGNHIAQIGITTEDTVTVTIPEGYCYIDIKKSTSGTEFSFSKVQIEEGDTATDYELYIEPVTTNIYLDEPLRKVGDYADYVDFANCKVIRNIKEKVLNGDENWSTYSAAAGKYYTSVLDDNFMNLNNGICSHFSWVQGANQDGECYIAGDSTSYHNFFLMEANLFPTKDDLLAFLNENNVKFISAIKIPIEETIELPNIPTHKGTNIIEIDTTIQPSNMELQYYGKPA